MLMMIMMMTMMKFKNIKATAYHGVQKFECLSVAWKVIAEPIRVSLPQLADDVSQRANSRHAG